MFRTILSKLLTLLLLGAIAAPAAAQGEKALYKLGLVLNGEKNHQLDGDVLNAVTQAFFESKRFTMVERKQLDSVFTEKDLQGFLGKGSQTLSDVLGLDLVGLVSYTAGTERQGAVSYEVFVLEVRLVDVKTGQILGTITSERPDAVLPASTVREAGRDLFQSIREAFPPFGYVVKVTGKEVVIDLGSDAGLKKGDELEIVREGEQIIHPVTGQALPAELVVVGVLKVVSASPQLANCKTKSEAVTLGSTVRLKAKNSILKKGFGVLCSVIDCGKKN
jgi:hypothetical protein